MCSILGAFEIHYESHDGVAGSSTNKVMKQMVPQLPIGWSDRGSNGPMTLIGMREWQDISLSVDFKLPPTAPLSAAGCVATRVDQMWRNGIVFCLAAGGSWNLTVGGPQLGKGPRGGQLIVGGTLPKPPGLDKWITVEISTVDSMAAVSVNGASVVEGQAIRNIDTGFGAIGANDWFAIEYDNLSIKEVGTGWHPTPPCGHAKVNDALFARNCSSNGVLVNDLTWELDANWMLRHVPSGLCATASGNTTGSKLSLQKCVLGNDLQKFTNDYTRIRNTEEPLTLHNTGHAVLAGRTNGAVFIQDGQSPMKELWSKWVFFPNTGQLRNQYVANTKLGYPMCLTTCSP